MKAVIFENVYAPFHRTLLEIVLVIDDQYYSCVVGFMRFHDETHNTHRIMINYEKWKTILIIISWVRNPDSSTGNKILQWLDIIIHLGL